MLVEIFGLDEHVEFKLRHKLREASGTPVDWQAQYCRLQTKRIKLDSLITRIGALFKARIPHRKRHLEILTKVQEVTIACLTAELVSLTKAEDVQLKSQYEQARDLDLMM